MSTLQNFIAKAQVFLNSARTLFQVGDYDSCASRCYYAMFLAAEAVLMTKGISPSTHRGVITLFSQQFVRSGDFPAEMGRLLSRAYDARIAGDYATELSVSADEAAHLITGAQEFLDRVESYLRARGDLGSA